MKKIFISFVLVFIFLFLFSNKIYARGCGKPGDCGAGETCDPTTFQCVPGEKPSTVSIPTTQPVNELTPTCNYGSGTNNGINTAVGCVPFGDTNDFVSFVLRWAIGIGGGIAFLLILYSGFMIMTSQGNPDRLKAGQELLTSALAGLIMLIFSVFILKIIGVDILQLPGLK